MFLRSFSLVTVILSLPFVTGQTTDATCLPFYAWTDNSQNQSPCQVAATLLGVCGPYDVEALPADSQYSGPALGYANSCICSTVVYSLMSACGACQGETYETWSTWSGNCPSVAISAFPLALPLKTFVPGWAYLDVETSDIFNETAARLVANTTAESTAVPVPTSTPASTTSSTLSTSVIASSSTTPAANDSTSASSHHADVVMGAIVGSVLGAALLFGILFWWIRRRRSTDSRGVVSLQSPVEDTPPRSPHIKGPQTADMQQYLENTVPAQVAASSISTSLASPTSAQFSNMSKPGSVRSNVPSIVPSTV